MLAGDERVFFQIAAALLPVLLFGTAVTALRAEWILARIGQRHKWAALVVATFLVALVMAGEFVAIDLSLASSEASAWKVTLVVQALGYSAYLAAVAVLLPWFDSVIHVGARFVAIALGISAVFVLLAGGYVADSYRSAEAAATVQDLRCGADYPRQLQRRLGNGFGRSLSLLDDVEVVIRQLGALDEKGLSDDERTNRERRLTARLDSLLFQQDTQTTLNQVLINRLSEERNQVPPPGC